MKIASVILALLTWFFTFLCYYFIFLADAGPDGLGTFFFIIITGVLGLIFFFAFLIQLWFVKEIKKGIKLVYVFVVMLPIIFILTKTFWVSQDSEPAVETIETLQ